MSVNLNVRFEIHNIKEIHFREDKTAREEIFAAAKAFLTEEDLLGTDMEMDFIGKDGYLCAYTTSPIIISRFDDWQPRITQKWNEMAVGVLGDSCEPAVTMEFPDDDY